MVADGRRGGLLLVAVALGGIGGGLGAAALLMPRVVVVQPQVAAPAPPPARVEVPTRDVWRRDLALLDRQAHPFLGVLVESECELQALRGVPCPRRGAHVVDVHDDTAAQEAGIQAGDLIVSFDGEPVLSSRDLVRLVRAATPRAMVDVVVRRAGEDRTVRAAPR
jgi:membrane-associated protease RseP (regulator of RpoE activity)